jgi:hypothetical protein
MKTGLHRSLGSHLVHGLHESFGSSGSPHSSPTEPAHASHSTSPSTRRHSFSGSNPQNLSSQASHVRRKIQPRHDLSPQKSSRLSFRPLTLTASLRLNKGKPDLPQLCKPRSSRIDASSCGCPSTLACIPGI